MSWSTCLTYWRTTKHPPFCPIARVGSIPITAITRATTRASCMTLLPPDRVFLSWYSSPPTRWESCVCIPNWCNKSLRRLACLIFPIPWRWSNSRPLRLSVSRWCSTIAFTTNSTQCFEKIPSESWKLACHVIQLHKSSNCDQTLSSAWAVQVASALNMASIWSWTSMLLVCAPVAVTEWLQDPVMFSWYSHQ